MIRITGRRGVLLAIQGFADRDTEALFRTGRCPARWRQVSRVAMRKLDMLNAATRLSDLGALPGNRLEPLAGNRQGQHSIRVNDRWRVCFVWTEFGPDRVEIVDYHRG